MTRLNALLWLQTPKELSEGESDPTGQLRHARPRVSGQHLGDDDAGDRPHYTYNTGIIP
jgi:hypothetical protein